MNDDEWVKLAMEDNSVVVEQLLRLNQAQPPPLMAKFPTTALHVDWTVRQRRSKPLPRHIKGKKKTESTRASPTTPLSWSGGTSASGGAADGFEESSQVAKSSDGAGSKFAVKNDTLKTTKRSRKKKTLPELKGEETLLLEERRNLKNALATLRLTVEKQRATNKFLKEMKLDLQSRQTIKTVTTSAVCKEASSDQSHSQKTETMDYYGCNDLNALHCPFPFNDSCKPNEIEGLGAATQLPDLNLPVDEVLGSEVEYRMS